VIFVDSNIPMYLVGAEHPNKATARRLVEDAVAAGEGLVSDAEVMQEIIHRYAAIRRIEFIQVAFDALLAVVDQVFPIEGTDVVRAKSIVLSRRPVSARDALHIAVMERRGVKRVLSFDTDFDRYPGIERVSG